jgi:hypothetical protein
LANFEGAVWANTPKNMGCKRFVARHGAPETVKKFRAISEMPAKYGHLRCQNWPKSSSGFH